MEMFRFNANFREMVKRCISIVSFSVMVEGSPTEVFHAQRGVR